MNILVIPPPKMEVILLPQNGPRRIQKDKLLPMLTDKLPTMVKTISLKQHTKLQKEDLPFTSLDIQMEFTLHM
jgi:hypothetical protein